MVFISSLQSIRNTFLQQHKCCAINTSLHITYIMQTVASAISDAAPLSHSPEPEEQSLIDPGAATSSVEVDGAEIDTANGTARKLFRAMSDAEGHLSHDPDCSIDGIKVDTARPVTLQFQPEDWDVGECQPEDWEKYGSRSCVTCIYTFIYVYQFWGSSKVQLKPFNLYIYSYLYSGDYTCIFTYIYIYMKLKSSNTQCYNRHIFVLALRLVIHWMLFMTVVLYVELLLPFSASTYCLYSEGVHLI